MRNSKLAVASVLIVALGLFVVATPAPAGALETNYQNPVTAAPPIVRPETPSCTVLLAENHAFGPSGYDVPATGTYTPPAACAPPWSMVVLDWTGTVAGRQFDREAEIWIGSAMVYMGTTPEPTPAGITWHVEKDVSEYTPVLQDPQPFAIHLPNVVNRVYTGVVYVTATLTFYETSVRSPAASHPDAIVGLTNNWLFVPGRSKIVAPAVTLPLNPVRVYLEMWAKGNSCDEFWYASEPDAYAATYGLCGGGAFREIQVYLDGRLAGVVWPFPYIFTGGVNPWLWRPIPAVDGFDEPPYSVDLTPFAGSLSDSLPHTISFLVVNNGFYWQIGGNVVVFEDPAWAETSGALTSYDIPPDPDQGVVQTVGTNSATFDFTAGRTLSLEGYVETSMGRITTTVQDTLRFSSHQVLNLVNFRENLVGSETIASKTTTSDPRGTTVVSVSDSYPIRLASMFMIPAAAANSHANSATEKFILPAEVDQSFIRHVAVSRNGAAVLWAALSDSVHAEAVLVRSLVTGQNAVANGHVAEDYDSSDSTGACYHHVIQASQGYVTSDRLLQRC